MSNYIESKKEVETIRNKYGEMIFRAAISHLMDVGIRHLTEENVEETCKSIMQEDDSRSFMTNAFKCDIIRAAYGLSLISHIDLLVYIQREVTYDVFDGMPSYERVIELLKKCMGHIEVFEDDNIITLEVFEELGFDDDDLSALGFEYLLSESEEE